MNFHSMQLAQLGLTTSLAEFQGGFVYGRMSEDGDTWTFEALSATLSDDTGRLVMIRGRHTISTEQLLKANRISPTRVHAASISAARRMVVTTA